MEYRELITIVTVSLDWHSKSDMSYVLVMEILADMPDRYYMAKKPTLNYKLKKQLRYYNQVLN